MNDPLRMPEHAELLARIAELERQVAVGQKHEVENRSAQIELRDSLAYAESILDTIRQPMLVLDHSLHVRTASRSFYSTFHTSPEDTLGRFVYDLGNGQWNIPLLRKLLEEVLSIENSFCDFEVVHEFPLAGSKVMLLNARKLWREQNNSEHILLAIEDVTAKRRAEEELVRSNDDLRSFAYIAAHDLRYPLRCALSLLQLVLKPANETLHKNDREKLTLSVKNLQHLGTLMQDILTFSVAGNVSQQPVMMSLEEPLNRALANLQHHIEQAGATITAFPLPAALADPTQMVIVFQNLIGNAVKYGRGEPPVIRVEAHQEGKFWRVSISDNGQGFDPEHATIIFEPFKRLHGTNVPGSGIGLATCKRIIERLGGRIWAESTAGVGSTFHFTLQA